MGEIKRVAILGAGAMGAFFASRFLETEDFWTTVVAGGERRARLERDGLEVNGKRYQVPVSDLEETAEPADLIIVAVKYHHLSQGVRDLRNLVGAGTTILSVMNGLDSEEILGAAYGMDKLLYAVSVGIDAQRKGNEITYTKPGKHYFGEATNREIGPRVRRVQAAFERAGITYEIPPDMIRILWWKFMINVGMNQASAVMRAPYGVFCTSPDAQALMEALMGEVIALAEAAGVNLTRADVDDWYAVLPTLSPQGRTSMHQDIEAGRKTEVEMFGGTVVARGEKHGIPTPMNQAVVWIIKVLEERGRG